LYLIETILLPLYRAEPTLISLRISFKSNSVLIHQIFYLQMKLSGWYSACTIMQAPAP